MYRALAVVNIILSRIFRKLMNGQCNERCDVKSPLKHVEEQ